MNTKIFSLILSLLTINAKVLAIPISKNDNSTPSPSVTDSEEECLTDECYETSKRILSILDTSVNPCDDFYRFSCGGWTDEKTTDIFGEIDAKIKRKLRKLLENDYPVNKKLSETEQKYDQKTFKKLKNLYNTCLNQDDLEVKGKETLIQFIKNLNLEEDQKNINDVDEFTKLLAKIHNNSINMVFVVEAFHDQKISNEYVPHISYRLPQIDYIFAFNDLYKEEGMDTSSYENIIKNYKGYIKTVLMNIYDKDQKKDIDQMTNTIFNIEKQLSGALVKYLGGMIYENESEPLRDSTNIKALTKSYSFINWKLYFEKRFEFNNVKASVSESSLIFNASSYILKYLSDIISKMDKKDFIVYSEWLIIDTYIDMVSEDLYNLKKEINKALYDVMDTPEEDEKVTMKEKCIATVNEIMPMALAKYYVESSFTEANKEEAHDMIEMMKEAMIQRLPQIEWLDDPTREYAVKKVSKMNNRIGYPDFILDPEKLYKEYERLEISADDYLFNIINFNIFDNIEKFSKIYNKNYKDDWLMPPQTVNAYYYPDDNSINFPAAIIQSPLFNINQQSYLNYAALGFIVGHELTHAFDDYGKDYDAEGKLNNWVSMPFMSSKIIISMKRIVFRSFFESRLIDWTDNDLEEFEEYAECFIDQYSEFTFITENYGNRIRLSGYKTLGENLADNGGLARAYEAWKMTFEKDAAKAKKRNTRLPGLSDYSLDQLFYIGFGQSLCDVVAEDKYLYDVHAPNRVRVNGVLSNSKHFAKTFNCPKNAPMNPTTKCSIW